MSTTPEIGKIYLFGKLNDNIIAIKELEHKEFEEIVNANQALLARVYEL